MTKSNEFVNHVLEMMQGIGAVRARAMFGGFGIYKDDLMFGLIADEELYFKVDQQNKEEFESEMLLPFVYVKKDKEMKMSYYQAPDSALENVDMMHRWALSGYEAATRAARKKKKK